MAVDEALEQVRQQSEERDAYIKRLAALSNLAAVRVELGRSVTLVLEAAHSLPEDVNQLAQVNNYLLAAEAKLADLVQGKTFTRRT